MSTFHSEKGVKSGHGFQRVDIGVDKSGHINVQNNMNNINNLTMGGHWVGHFFKNNVRKLMTMDRWTSVYKKHLSALSCLFCPFLSLYSL